jgi:hypothetical protein
MDADPPKADPPQRKRRRLQFSLRTFLIVMTAIPALIWACDHSYRIIEDGDLDVEMRYQAIVAETGRPVRDAIVEVLDEIRSQPVGGPLKTDADGIASRVCPDQICSWHKTALGFGNEFHAGAPWAVRLSAAGYSQTDWIEPNTREYEWRSEYLGNHKARATIRIPLRPLRH